VSEFEEELSATDAVFGKRSLRPDHPDLWRISQVIMRNDASVDEADGQDAKEVVWASIVGEVVDKDVMLYMAFQRMLRAFGEDWTRNPANLDIMGKIITLLSDSFLTGALYERAGGHRDDVQQDKA
jgi:hypothetical protein